MENNDNTLREMQEQMQQLREKLNSQKIINERMMHNSFHQTAGRLRFKSNLSILFAVAGILTVPSLTNMGVSFYFVIFTWIMLLVCIVATILTNRHIPSKDKDLVTAAEELTRFKKIHAEWIKFAIPLVIFWVGFLVWDFLRNWQFDRKAAIIFLAAIGAGAVLGGVLGFKMRRDQLNAADELLDQIEELRRED